jgi:hypothetical protein
VLREFKEKDVLNPNLKKERLFVRLIKNTVFYIPKKDE